MKKYLLLSLLIPCMFNTTEARRGGGGGRGGRSGRSGRYWNGRGGRGVGYGYGLGTAALIGTAAASRQPETIIIEKEAEKTTPQTDPLMMQQLNNLTLQMERINYQLEIVREENRNLRAQLRETQRK